MGSIIIEIPQNIKRTYRISSKVSGEALIKGVERLVEANTNGENKPAGREKVSLEGLVGLWADRPESAEEIARELRRRNNRVTNG